MAPGADVAPWTPKCCHAPQSRRCCSRTGASSIHTLTAPAGRRRGRTSAPALRREERLGVKMPSSTCLELLTRQRVQRRSEDVRHRAALRVRRPRRGPRAGAFRRPRRAAAGRRTSSAPRTGRRGAPLGAPGARDDEQVVRVAGRLGFVEGSRRSNSLDEFSRHRAPPEGFRRRELPAPICRAALFRTAH